DIRSTRPGAATALEGADSVSQLGLVHALEERLSEIAHRTGMSIRFWHRAVPKRIPEGIASCLFATAEQIMEDISRRPNCGNASVSLVVLNGEVHLSVRDFGGDIQAQKREPDWVEVGTPAIQEKIRTLKGRLWISSLRWQGTLVTARIPLP